MKANINRIVLLVVPDDLVKNIHFILMGQFLCSDFSLLVEILKCFASEMRSELSFIFDFCISRRLKMLAVKLMKTVNMTLCHSLTSKRQLLSSLNFHEPGSFI